MSASTLSVKYAILHKIATFNWAPTSHNATVGMELAKQLYWIGKFEKFDFGRLVFDLVTRHANNFKKTRALGLPGLIFGIIHD